MRRLLIISASCAALVAACSGGAESQETPSQASAASIATAATPSAGATPPATPSPQPTETTNPSPSPVSTAAVAPMTFSGRGNKTERFTTDGLPYVATITHSGDGTFVAYMLGADGTKVDELVNVVGDYAGTRLAYAGDWGGLQIKTDGTWTIAVDDVSTVPTFGSGTVKGSGDDVVRFDGPPGSPAHFTQRGKGNLRVWAETPDGPGFLFNNQGYYAGNYDGTHTIDPGLVRIYADQDQRWKIAVQ